jgi:molecular chaperone HscB
MVYSKEKEMNPFDIFEFPYEFDISQDALEQKYFILQRIYHPDRMIGKPQSQKDDAALMSRKINDAYDILLDPLTRGLALLEIQGVQVPPATSEVLMEIMEWGEQKSEGVDIFPEIEEKKVQALDQISCFFTQGDLMNAAHSLVKLQYLSRL